MTREEAIIILGNIPIDGDECYSIAEYQEAKTVAIAELKRQAEIERLINSLDAEMKEGE